MSDGTITFELTERDFVCANRAMFAMKRDTRAVYLFLALVAVVIAGWSLVARGGPGDYSALLMIALISAFTLWWWATPWLMSRNVKGHSTAFEAQTWNFSASGVDVRTRASHSSFEWSTIRRAVESTDYLFLYVADDQAYPIPKRAFQSAELDRFKAQLREWLGDRATLS